MYTDIVLAQ